MNRNKQGRKKREHDKQDLLSLLIIVMMTVCLAVCGEAEAIPDTSDEIPEISEASKVVEREVVSSKMTSVSMADETDEVENETEDTVEDESEEAVEDEIEDEVDDTSWRDAYAAFLRNSSAYEGDYFIIRDLDNNGVQELIVYNNLIFNIYSYNDNVYFIGEHNYYSATTQWRISDNSPFSGIFSCNVGGGKENYGYLTIENNEPVFENLWEQAATYPMEGEEIYPESSDNTELIAESKVAFNSDDALNFYEINEANIFKVIMTKVQ